MYCLILGIQSLRLLLRLLLLRLLLLRLLLRLLLLRLLLLRLLLRLLLSQVFSLARRICFKRWTLLKNPLAAHKAPIPLKKLLDIHFEGDGCVQRQVLALE
jgi:hypothetical protein